MEASQPCPICSCTQVNLHDGFYFCAECGTQDTNFQETIIETIEIGGGEILHGKKKKLVRVVDEEKQMSDTWYKWHAFNFLLRAVADELLELGAKPSFKTKLLWVWTRYLKKYLKKEDMGLKENPLRNTMPEEEEYDSDEDEPPGDLLAAWDATRDKHIKGFSFTLLVTLIYIALNLDKSVITLTHLIKIFKDGLLSVPYRIEKVVPKELKPEKLYSKIRRGMANFKVLSIRVIAMTLFKRLDLGNPVVPDLRIIIDNHLKELCLPHDLKPLVLSLMHYKPCNFLDVNTKDNIIYKIPAYESYVLTYILWALKLCLGLDGDYDVKLSEAAEAINENEDRPKSYFINGESAPTNRLFSFREWVTFFQFRQTMLRHYCYRYSNKCSWDTDDYIALEQHMDYLDYEWERDMKDEMAYDMIKRLNGGMVETDVIPKSEFKPTLTPLHTYTQIIAEHIQDPEIKMRLTEDFTQYSLKYATEDFYLINPNAKKNNNIVNGIRVEDKIVTKNIIDFGVTNHSRKMVFVRNCENHNWLTTKPPTLEHVVRVDNLEESDDDKEDEKEVSNNNLPDSQMNGVHSQSHSISDISLANSTISNRIHFSDDVKILESNKLSASEKEKLKTLSDSVTDNSKFPDTVSDNSFSNSTLSNSIRFIDETKVFQSGKLDKTELEKSRNMNDKLENPYEIKEEGEEVNIFDDDFKPGIKEEVNSDCEMGNENTFNGSYNFQDVPCNNQSANRDADNHSVASSIDSVNFNEATFDRAKAIKEIILYTCKKHKLPIPSEYNPKTGYKKEMGFYSRQADFMAFRKRIYPKRNITHEKARRDAWKAYVNDYNAAMQNDIFNQIAQKVNTAIQNAEDYPPNEENPPLDNFFEDTNAMEVDVTSNHSDLVVECERASDEEKLFSDESDGETHAKELLPQKNPDFDEEEYDASQLYVKAAKTAEDGEMELDPHLYGIIDKKIKKDAKDPSLLTWAEERKKLARPDSEDEMPLSVLQELKELTKKLSEQEEETLNPFLDKKTEIYNHWFKFYKSRKITLVSREFDRELDDRLPKSFVFVLRQCAFVLGLSLGELYRHLQHFEMVMVERHKFDLEVRTRREKPPEF